jgi:hypothetical protein
MTVQEMYQELQQQQLEDNLYGCSDLDLYDDCYIIEVDYTTQE